MAGNRKQPFGYRMEFGEYTPHPAEAETVRWIYQTYLAGASYQELVEALQERGIAYDEGKAVEQKHGGPHPGGQEIQRDRPVSGHTPGGAVPRCSGAPQGPGGPGQKNAGTDGAAAAVRRSPACLGGTADPDASEPSCPAPGAYCLRPDRNGGPGREQETETGAGGSSPIPACRWRADQEYALRLAEHRLNAIGAEEYETTRLQKLFRNHPLMEELERELLCESVRQITYRGKGIQVRLKNGQIMKGGQQP